MQVFGYGDFVYIPASWEASNLQEILGENMGVVSLPTYTLNGEEKQMYSYAGSKVVGVNAKSKHMVASIQLAIYLGSAEAQKLRYRAVRTGGHCRG